MRSFLYTPVSEGDNVAEESSLAYHSHRSRNIPPSPIRASDNESSSSTRCCTTNHSSWTASLFSVTMILLFADQNLMAPNLTAIAREFGFNNDQRDKYLGGDIALAFFVVGAPASYLVGCLGDSPKLVSRITLFTGVVGIGEAACLLTYFSSTYTQLYACRAVTGFALGGALPLVYSILGDLFVAEQRHAVSAVVGIGTGIGIAFGQAVAGFLGPTFGWRLPFLVISMPSLICSLLVYLLVNDPPRGGAERVMQDYQVKQENYTHCQRVDHDATKMVVEIVALDRHGTKSIHTSQSQIPDSSMIIDSRNKDDLLATHTYCTVFWTLISTKTVLLALLQGAPGCVPWGIINSFLNDFLSENRGMTVQLGTLTVLFFGMGNFFGMLLGGFSASYLYRLDCRYPSCLAGISAIGACFPFWVLLNFITNETPIVWIAFFGLLAGLLSGVTGPIIKATLQNVTLPTTRGQAFALFNTFDDFGRGIGPVFVATLIRKMGERTPAFNWGVTGWIICGMFNLLICFTVHSDEEQVQEELSSQMESRLGSPKFGDNSCI